MRVRLTMDKRMFSLVKEEAKKYGIPVNRLMNCIVSAADSLEPRFYKIERDNEVKDVKVNSENRNIWNKKLRRYKNTSKSELLRAYVAAYLFMPIYVREAIIYKEIIDDIKDAIENKESIKISHTKDEIKYQKRTVDPYDIVTTQSEENNYLIAFCHKRQELRAFRISRISKVNNSLKKYEVKKEYTDILKKADKYFDGFLSYGNYVKVELTDMGLSMLNIITMNRPLEIEKELVYANPADYNVSLTLAEVNDEHIKVFECSPYQCEAYFFQYLENVLILEPKAVRDRMYNRVKLSVQKIESATI